MVIAVAIETKDRRIPGICTQGGSRNYLAQTLRNFARAGCWESPYLHSVHLVCGGGTISDFVGVLPDSGKAVIHPCPPGGCTRQQNGARAIRIAAGAGADWVLKLEDDLDFIDDFIGSVARWLGDYGDSDVAMFSLAMALEGLSDCRYAEPNESVLGPGSSFPRVRSMLAAGKSFVVRPPQGFWGAQALAWKRRRAQEIADWLGDDPFYWNGEIAYRDNAHDFKIAEWVSTTDERAIGVALPAFVQHIGRESSIASKDRWFQFPWPGPDWTYKTRMASK